MTPNLMSKVSILSVPEYAFEVSEERETSNSRFYIINRRMLSQTVSSCVPEVRHGTSVEKEYVSKRMKTSLIP